jgi:hypothetical protein
MPPLIALQESSSRLEMEEFMSEPAILVVEDEPSISEVVTTYLQRAGY